MLQDATLREEGMSVWSFLEHMGAGRLLRVTSAEAFTLALDEVFLEMYHNVLKRVRPAPKFLVCCLMSYTSSVTPLSPFLAGIHVEKGARAT